MLPRSSKRLIFREWGALSLRFTEECSEAQAVSSGWLAVRRQLQAELTACWRLGALSGKLSRCNIASCSEVRKTLARKLHHSVWGSGNSVKFSLAQLGQGGSAQSDLPGRSTDSLRAQRAALRSKAVELGRELGA